MGVLRRYTGIMFGHTVQAEIQLIKGDVTLRICSQEATFRLG